jgi:hypothetical protein
MECPASRPQLPLTGGQVDRVVGVAPIRCAAAGSHESTVAQLAQVIGDEILRLVQAFGELPDRSIALDQFSKQAPSQGVRNQPGELRRALAVSRDTSRAHTRATELFVVRCALSAVHVAHQSFAA